ncbi:hypothetical protein M422DRAFT_67303, partial [Sphaerobolus stellatus SS14]
MVSLTLIVAATRTNGIGRGSILPWRLPSEMAYFARVTKIAPPEQTNVVIMGRKTWESIPKKRRPLVDRVNVVLSSNTQYDLGLPNASSLSFVEPSLEAGLDRITRNTPHNTSIYRRFVIGGATLYNEALALQSTTPESPAVDRILLTHVSSPEFEDCDVFFPDFISTGKWKRTSHAELQEWVGFEVPGGEQDEGGVKYEFQMWVKEE